MPRPWRAVGALGATTATVALVGCGSRAAWVGAEVGAAVLLVTRRRLLLFPLAEIDPVWWLCCGMVVTRRTAPGAAPAAPTATRRLVAAGAGAIAAVALAAGVLDVAADRLARRALDQSPAAGVDAADAATRLRPDDVRYRLVAAIVHSRRGSLRDVDLALDQIADAARWSPRDPLVGDERATLLSQGAGITGSEGDGDAAVRAWRALVARDPHRARWQLGLGRAAALAGEVDEARQAWQRAADLDPHDPTAAALIAVLPPT